MYVCIQHAAFLLLCKTIYMPHVVSTRSLISLLLCKTIYMPHVVYTRSLISLLLCKTINNKKLYILLYMLPYYFHPYYSNINRVSAFIKSRYPVLLPGYGSVWYRHKNKTKYCAKIKLIQYKIVLWDSKS